MNHHTRPRASLLVILAVTCGVLASVIAVSRPLVLKAQSTVPQFEVDRSWPAQLPEGWTLGPVAALCVDSQDHLFLLNRQEEWDVYNPKANPGENAPPVIEFDTGGRVVNSWKEDVFPKDFVANFHGCHFDAQNNLWIVSTSAGFALQYSHDGKRLMQIGKSDVVDSSDGTRKGKPLNSDAAQFFGPAAIDVDRQNGDIYVDDGDGNGNRRIAVMDKTGKFLRQFKPQIAKSIHCMSLANDGLIYLCARTENQLQVYDKMGNLKQKFDVAWKPYRPATPADEKKELPGSAAGMALSRDPNNRLMFVNNQNNARIDVLDRQTGKVLSSFGRPGHLPGNFDQALSLAADSAGNVYVGEHRGLRVQKFKQVFK